MSVSLTFSQQSIYTSRYSSTYNKTALQNRNVLIEKKKDTNINVIFMTQLLVIMDSYYSECQSIFNVFLDEGLMQYLLY